MAASALEIQLRELKDLLSQQRSMITTQTAMIETLQKSLDEKSSREKELLEQNKRLQEQVDYLLKKRFGASSEKREIMPDQLSYFDEAETLHEQESSKQEEIPVAAHTRKAKASHKEIFAGLPVEKVVIELSEEERICEDCGTEMVLMGEEFVRRELELIPAKLKVREIYTQTYVCPSCKEAMNGAETPVFHKSKAPEALIQNSYASASTVAWTMYQKYGNSLPLYRQEKDWKQYGAEVNRATLANWIITCANEYFKPMYEFFHRELLKRKFAMADETRVQVLKEPGREAERQSFMWLFRSGEDGLPPIVLYGYSPTRSGDMAANFLKGFQGYLETDGYQGYNKVDQVQICSCWSHIRRYFLDAIPRGKEYDFNQPAVQAVKYCDTLFHHEEMITRQCKGDYEKRYKLRLEREKPILEAFWSWLDHQTASKNSKLYKALIYTRNRRESAMRYLEDGRCSFTNNASENAIRPFTVGRKNWLFSDSVKGAEASSIVYTIVEMAKAYNLNIYEYLKFLLEHRPNNQMTDDELAVLAPWSEILQPIKNDSQK